MEKSKVASAQKTKKSKKILAPPKPKLVVEKPPFVEKTVTVAPRSLGIAEQKNAVKVDKFFKEYEAWLKTNNLKSI